MPASRRRAPTAPTVGACSPTAPASSASRPARSGSRSSARRARSCSPACDAEQVLGPGTSWHYSNLAFALLGEVVTRAHGGSRRTPSRSDPRSARPLPDDARSCRSRRLRLLRRALLGGGPGPSRGLDLGGAGALGKLWSTTGDLARWGAFLAAGDDRVLNAATLEEMAHVRVDGRPQTRTLAWGTGLALSPLRRPPFRRPRRRHARTSGRPRRQSQDRGLAPPFYELGRRPRAGEARA